MTGPNQDAGAQVAVLGQVAVSLAGATLAGSQLGGRRALVALAALALSDGPLTAERIAAAIWADKAPPTWPVAVRGVIAGLRGSLAAIGAGDQLVIATTAAGYRLAPDVDVDVARLRAALRAARELAAHGRHQATLDTAAPVAAVSGDQLLPAEDAPWLEPFRRELDDAALAALALTSAAASALGDHHRATAAARRAVAAQPLDERAHRCLIRALHQAGDRAGVVLAYEQCRSLLADQLGIDPAPETVQAYLAALGQQTALAVARPPAAGPGFFGRETELAWLAAAIGQPGLVTVAGRGGVGKSRLAIQVAAGAGELPGGRLWVSLASVAQDELVASSVAMTIGVRPGADVLAQLTSQLAPLGRALLILDGCEAVVDGVASLAAAVIASCPMLSVVVTSRVPLSVEGERLLTVEPLPGPVAAQPGSAQPGSAQPGSAQPGSASPQLRLLADRVRRAGGWLDADEAVTPFVAELLRRCGGLPLALELVAAQLAEMSPADLLDHLPIAAAGGEDQLRAVAWGSYGLLNADEAQLFRLFGLLDGPVPLPLIRDVAAGSIAPVRVVRILRELTSRALLTIDRSGPRWRYQQDDDLHAFARELLVAAGEEAAGLARLADCVGAILPPDPRAAPAPYLTAIGELLPSVRLLLGAALDGRLPRDRALELCFRLHRYWAATDVTEGRFWLSRLLAGEPRRHWTALASYALGYLGYWSGDADAAIRELRAAVSMLGQPNEYAARALIYLGGLADDLDRGDEAVEFVVASIDAAAPFGVDLQVSAAIGMGCVLAERADPQAARYAGEAIELCRRGGTAEQLTATLPTAAMVCWQVGDLAAARRYIAEARPLLAGSRRIAHVVMLSAAAGVALADGDVDGAIEIGLTAARDASDLGIDRELPLARAIVARAQLEKGDLTAAARSAVAAIEAARGLSFTFPLAVCLESAALVLLARLGEARPGDRAAPAGDGSARGDLIAADSAVVAAQLLASAAAIRARGSRPGIPALSAAVAAAEARLARRGGAVGSGRVLDAPVLDATVLDAAAAGALAAAALEPPSATRPAAPPRTALGADGLGLGR